MSQVYTRVCTLMKLINYGKIIQQEKKKTSQRAPYKETIFSNFNKIIL